MANELAFTVDGKRYELDIDKLTFVEARACERTTSMPFGVLAEALGQGSMEAMQVFIWTAMKRNDAAMEYGALDDMAIGDVEFHNGDDEPAGEAQPAAEPGPTTPAAA